MRRLTLIIIGLCAGILTSQAQQISQPERCSTLFPEQIQRFEQWLQSKEDFSIANIDEVYRIPVVVHVLHLGEALGEGTNVSDERVQAQIDIINEDFRKMLGTRGYNQHSDGADTRIQFELAIRKPDGSVTNGIDRVDISEAPLPPPEAGNMVMHSAYYSQWNTDHYLNIWTYPLIPEGVLLGQARFPESDLPGLVDEHPISWELPGIGEVDGVAINVHHFGPTGGEGRYSLGRTATHEIGHYLGLFHTWGPNSHTVDGCDLDDFCQDTPPIRDRTSGCPTNQLACDGRAAMVENYMDYADDACMNIFTNDQTSRMRTVLQNSPRRKSLLTSPALDPVLSIPDDLTQVVSIYPNPVAEKLTVSFDQHMLENVTIALHDMNGQRVFARAYDFVFQEALEILIPPSPESMLFLTITSGKSTYRQKLIRR